MARSGIIPPEKSARFRRDDTLRGVIGWGGPAHDIRQAHRPHRQVRGRCDPD